MRQELFEAIRETAGKIGSETGKAEAAVSKLREVLQEIKDYHDHGQVHPKSLIIDALELARAARDHSEAASSHFYEYTALIGERDLKWPKPRIVE